MDNPFDFDVEGAKNIDELRDFARKHNINLEGATLRADIEDRIREVIGD